MGGITLPDGYTLRSYTTYSNNQTVKDRLKNGKDLVTVKVIDSRGNISSLIKELGVSFYAPPYFPEIEAVRVNDIDTQTRLKGTGKKIADDSISYIKYTSSTQPWTNGSTSGTTYGPFYIASSEITYSSDNTEFYLNSLIQGDLGASGFTKVNKYYLKIEIATGLNESFPMTTFIEVKTGKILMSYADDGVAFGGDYDENLAGALQVFGDFFCNGKIAGYIPIGGRNYAFGSDVFNVGAAGNGITPNITSEGYLQVTALSTNDNWFTSWFHTPWFIEEEFSEGEDFTISFTMRTTNNANIPDIYLKPGMGYYKMKGNLSTGFSTVYYTGKWKKDGILNFHFGMSGVNGTVIIKNWKIEKGIIPTAWTLSSDQSWVDGDWSITKFSDGRVILYGHKNPTFKGGLAEIALPFSINFSKPYVSLATPTYNYSFAVIYNAHLINTSTLDIWGYDTVTNNGYAGVNGAEIFIMGWWK